MYLDLQSTSFFLRPCPDPRRRDFVSVSDIRNVTKYGSFSRSDYIISYFIQFNLVELFEMPFKTLDFQCALVTCSNTVLAVLFDAER